MLDDPGGPGPEPPRWQRILTVQPTWTGHIAPSAGARVSSSTRNKFQPERFGNLGEIANQVVAEVNHYLFSEEHTYHVKNTRTGEGDTEMERTLTYYAIRNRKTRLRCGGE